MAIEQIPGGLWIPAPIAWGAANPNFGNLLMDASAEKVAFIIQAPKTGTLNGFEFLIGTATQVPANGLKLSFQDVDMATGNPDGTADQYRVEIDGLGEDTWVTSDALTSDGADTGTKRSVTRGEYLACVVEFQSFSASDSLNIRMLNLAANSFMGNTPYATHFTASWAKQDEGVVMALKYDDGYETVLGIYPFESIGSSVYNVDSGSGDEVGMSFSVPSDVRVGAFYMRANLAGNADLVLYDKDGLTVLETMSLDKDLRTQSATQYHLVRCPTDRLLYANEAYRLILKPTTTTNVTLYTVGASSTGLMDTLEGGSNWFTTFRVDGTNWNNDSTTIRPLMGIVITGIDHDISGGSGGPGWEGDA